MIHLLDQLTKLAESGRKLAEVTDLDELYENVFDLVAAVFDNQTAAILLRNPKDGTLSIVASRGYDPEVVKNFKVAPGQGVTGYVLQTGESQLVTEQTGKQFSAAMDFAAVPAGKGCHDRPGPGCNGTLIRREVNGS